jgi:hypothetical protein
MTPQNKAIELFNQFKFETQSDEANKMLEDVAFFSCKIFINEILKNCSSKKVIYWQQVNKFILEHYTNKILNVRVKHTEENNPTL